MDFHGTPYRLIAHIRQDQASLTFRKNSIVFDATTQRFCATARVAGLAVVFWHCVFSPSKTWHMDNAAQCLVQSAYMGMLNQGHKDPPETLLNQPKMVQASCPFFGMHLNNHHFKSLHDENLLVTKNPSSPCTALVHCSWSRAVSRSSASFDLRDEGMKGHVRAAKRKQQFQLGALGSFEALGFVPEAFYYQNFHLWTIHVSCWFSIESSRSYLLRNLAQMSTQTHQVKSS